MKTLTLRSMALCGSIPTTAAGITAFSAGRSLAFAEAILAKYSGMAGTEPSGAVMVFLTAHKEEAETERRRRERIELALRLVFVKYLAGNVENRPITINNTFADYLGAASILINAPARIESPRAFTAMQTLSMQLQAAKDPEAASGALAAYFRAETNVLHRAQLVHTVESILQVQAAQEPSVTAVPPVQKETIRRFAELVHRENPAEQLPVDAAEAALHEREVQQLREKLQINTSAEHTERIELAERAEHTEQFSERTAREVQQLREQLHTKALTEHASHTEREVQRYQTDAELYHRETLRETAADREHTEHTTAHTEREVQQYHTDAELHHRETLRETASEQ